MILSVKAKQIVKLSGHAGSIYALEKIDDTSFISGGSDSLIAQWFPEINNEGSLLARTTSVIYSLRYLAIKNILLAGISTGGIHVIDMLTKTETRHLQLFKVPVFVIAYSHNHELTIAGSGDGSCAILDADFQLRFQQKLSEGKIRSIAFHPTENFCAIGSSEGIIYILDLKKFELLKSIAAHRVNFGVNSICFSPDGKQMLSGSRDACLNVFDCHTFELLRSIPAHNYAIYDIAFHSSGKLFATCSRDKTIKLWETSSNNVITRLAKEEYDGHTNSVNKILWINDHLVSAGDDRSILVWKINSYT